MAVIFGTILVLAGFACGAFGVLVLARANSTTPLPMFTSAPSRPRASVLLNVGSVALVIWGANIMTPDIGGWAFVVLIVAGLVPFLAVRLWHNRRVAAGTQH
jgi:Flp pilus assembly protein TadB